jgi:hypothetical protein
VILDTDGNIFGGCSPMEWEWRKWNGKYDGESNCSKADDSQKSFLFTLKNPHNAAEKRFALKTEKRIRQFGLILKRVHALAEVISCSVGEMTFVCPITAMQTLEASLPLATLPQTLRIRRGHVFPPFGMFSSEKNRSLRDDRLNSSWLQILIARTSREREFLKTGKCRFIA